ncbi:BRCA2-interacting transcriptional repressor EMSY [Aricia agestis]|uniref:BRCA2-interacting transcriptional repressor EMSY n=1 Tax=Aricia agestis TaxID=91739 RepID=UPI001C20931D|nr:BRCA2-interacting transcriptional repressor EMSY [Aricia agestis]
MWPILLNMTRDECRQTLRRLELEAYSNMMSVFRAQGALEDNRKKLLEELRAVLHISRDRHTAEARRVSNDELLATIADQLAGPNTGLGWISEGRRLVPLLPRGIAQTMYTEVADKAAESSASENIDIKKKVETENFVPKLSEDEIETSEDFCENQQSEPMDETLYPPVATEDQSSKVWETELICRKRKIPESNSISEDSTTPVKNVRNIPANSNQKHLNLSQVYSRFSQSTGKSSGHSKHSYNQVSKVSTTKSQSHRSVHHKPRAYKQRNLSHAKMQKKSQETIPRSPQSQQLNPGQLQPEYSKSPSTFQSTFSQTVLGKMKSEYIDETKSKIIPTTHVASDISKTPQHSTAHTEPLETTHEDDSTSYSPTQDTAPLKQNIGGKHCQLLVKKRNEIPEEKKIQIQDFKIIQKPTEGLKVISNRQVMVAPSSAQRVNTAAKLVTTKVVSSVSRPRSSNTPLISRDKMIVVSKPSGENRFAGAKMVVTSSPMTTPSKDLSLNSSITNKTSDALTPKGIPATDLKVSAKTFVVNPKSGQKMVVVPAKGGKEGQIPLFHFKGMPTTMKLVSMASSQPAAVSKSNTAPKPTVISTLPSNTKNINVEPIKTANLADIVPVKGLTPATTPKITNPIVRPVTKGNVIVITKGSTIGKAVSFTKNGNDMSKIIMGKNVNQLLQANKPDKAEQGKTGNVIVLELNNEQTGRTTTMSEILDSRSTNVPKTDQNRKPTDLQITQDTPVLFESQINDDACNATSLDSAQIIGDMRSIEGGNISLIDKDDVNKSNFNKENIGIKDDSSIADWDMELAAAVPTKSKDPIEKLNSLNLDLGMSSDSESEFIMDGHKIKTKHSHSPQDRIQSATPTGVDSERYSSSSLSLATRTLLSQLQDDGSSSNDSSFALRTKSSEKFKGTELRIDKTESEALSKAKAKLSEKVAEAKSQQKRIDVYSTAITTSDINLDSFSYLEEGLMAGDDEFASDGKRDIRQTPDALDDQLSRLLGEDSANSTDSHIVSESLSLSKS